jgi:ubiquinone/menaquinone biosynthesis C-methylase UbiE
MTTGEATASEVEAARNDPKLANILYHDWEATSYDDKWHISYDERCIRYARRRFEVAVGKEWDGSPYPTALELGSGTGFFLLNLISAGVVAPDGGSVTDISPGMVEVAKRNGANLGYKVDGRVADAESLPFDDASFDLVVGHAVLHHIPDVELSIREVLRVLKPGGRFVFAGEPTKYGDVVARRLSRWTWKAVTKATELPGLTGWSRPKEELKASSEAAALEAVVDLHTFAPSDLKRIALRAGAVDVQVKTEELLAAWLGWPLRTFESAIPRERLGMRYANFAYSTWRKLMWLDENVMDHVAPDDLFYNALVTGVRPESG